MATSKKISTARRAKLGVKTASIASRKLPSTRNPDGSVKERDKTGGAAKGKTAKTAKSKKAPAKSTGTKRTGPEAAAATDQTPRTNVVPIGTARANGQPDAKPVTAPAGVESEDLAPAQSIELPAKIVRAALAIAGTENLRHYLNGVYVHQLADKALRVVATDGHRLLVASLPQETTIDWARKGTIIPSADLARVVKYLGNKVESLELAFGVDHRQVVIEERPGIATFRIPVIDESYPAYQKICDAAAAVFSAEREEMSMTQLDAKYLRSAGAIAALLGSRGIIPFLPEDGAKIASVFAFNQTPEVLLYIMPQPARSEVLPAATTRLFGKAAMQETLARLDEQIKKTRANAKDAKHKKFAEQFAAKAERLQARADQLRAALITKLTGPAPAAQEKAPQTGSDAAGPTVH